MKIQRPGQKQVILTQTKPPLSQQYPSPSNSWRIFNLTVCGLIAERSPTGRIFVSRLPWWNGLELPSRQKSAGRWFEVSVWRGQARLARSPCLAQPPLVGVFWEIEEKREESTLLRGHKGRQTDYRAIFGLMWLRRGGIIYHRINADVSNACLLTK